MTKNPFISSEHLGNIINQCASDLRNGKSTKLFELAGVMNAIADCNNSPYLHIFPQDIGSFSTELIRSRSLTMIPVLPEEERKSYSELVKTASEKGISALESIKKQLCDNNVPDYGELMDSIGTLFQQASILRGETIQLTDSQQEQN